MPPCEYKEIAVTPIMGMSPNKTYPYKHPMQVPKPSWEDGTASETSSTSGVNYDTSDTEDSSSTPPHSLLSLQALAPSSSKSGSLGICDLCPDVQLNILTYLKPSEARSVLVTCHRLRRLLLSKDALYVWTQWCRAQWPVLSSTSAQKLTFSNDMHLPTALSSSHSSSRPNLSVLLAMASWSHPSCINDKTLVSDPRRSQESRHSPVLREFTQDGVPVVQFMGQVGTENRSIRADDPLPRPRGGLSSNQRFYHKRSTSEPPIFPSGVAETTHRRSLRHWLQQRHNNKSSSSKPSPYSQPFVAPYMTPDCDDKVHLTPRLVSYFEVSILSRDESQEPSPLNHGSNHDDSSTSATDCVAIGLSVNGFKFRSRLPGWDRYSYGYHGDDGGIFHGSGTAYKHFGPKFGVGDVVGCGVDYVCSGIFFTLNGKFLGYGWTGLDLSFLPYDGLYPTVGVDTNHPVSCNFGDRPFQFDLQPFVKHHQDIVKESLGSLVAAEQQQVPSRSKRHFRALECFVPKHHRKRSSHRTTLVSI